MITASQLERLANCPGSFRAPGFSHTSIAAQQGTENHARIEDGTRVAWRSDAQREIAYVIQTDTWTVTRLGESRGRDYGISKERELIDVGCTVDAEVWFEGSDVEIRDFKSRRRVTSAARNWQVRIQALAVWLYYQLPVIAGLYYLDNDEEDVHTFSEFDHLATQQDLRRVLTALSVEPGELATGPWCEYCPAATACPAQRQELLGILDHVDIEATFRLMTDAEVARAINAAKRFEAIVDRIKTSGRYQVMARGGIDIGNERRLEMVLSQRQSLDSKAMSARLTELGEDMDLYRRVTKFSRMQEVKK